MRIQSIQNNNIYYQTQNQKKTKQPSFQEFTRTVVKPGSEKVLWKNNTGFFRIDMSWSNLVKLLVEKYAKEDKVQVFLYASSIGLEAYTFLMELLANYDETVVNKFTPIIAKDFDEYAIKMAQKRVIDVSDKEKEKINLHTNNRFDDFMERVSLKDNKYRPKPILTDKVIFSVGDFTKEYKDLPKDKIVLFTRNCWPYFPQEAKDLLPQKLYNHLGEKVTLITGNFDYMDIGFNKFRNCGFKRTYIPYVYEK